jgi:hypothetical protein
MGLMDRAKKAWAEKQEKWAEESEIEEAEKAEKASFRVNLEELLDRFEMKDLKSFCKDVLGTLPPTDVEQDKKTGRDRRIEPDRHTFVDFILQKYDDEQLKPVWLTEFAVKRKIVAKSFFGEESRAGDVGEFRKIINSIRDDFEAEKIWTEQHLEDQLKIHLQAKFGKMKIERQVAAPSGGQVDILIEGQYVLELKVPRSRSDLRDLGGQLEEYKEDFPYVCAVIAFVDADDYHVTQDEIMTYVDKYKSKYNVPSVVKDVKKRVKKR